MSFPLDEAALAAVEARLTAGLPLAEAVDGYLDTRSTDSGATVIVDSGNATRDSMASALRFLALVRPASARSVAVLGDFEADPAEALEEHDYIGRLVVRLNVDQLIAVGYAARHIHSAAGLEGSWDGESVIVDTAQEAYDLLRADIRGNDVVLLMGAQRLGLGALAERLGGVTQ